ncbi:MAG: vitamin B12 dependent-methionine synthase activation domain-containing protein, partial [bacterium]
HDGNTQKVIEVLRAQDSGGAHALDICFASTEQDEMKLWRSFASSFKGIIKPPVFIDTTSNDVVQTALEFLPGKPVINSVNLEDGGERIQKLSKLKRYHPMSVVAGLIDENGMAKTYAEKLKVADKIHSFLCENGFNADEIIIDPLVFPLTTDIHPYDTIQAIGAIKEKFPKSAIILGVSNISFGLPPKTRSIINSVYIQMALKAGLDIAIVNVNHLARIDSISEDDLESAYKILEKFDKEALQELINKYRGVKLESKEDLLAGLEPAQRIETRIVEGIRDGMTREIDGLLHTMKPIDIINGPLVNGMNKVGELFSTGRLIISEVLLSAEVFKSAMDKLIPHIEKSSLPKAGKVVLATVKGDVHDIGRNLVGMILESHGFEVIDLGCRVSPETIIESVRKEKPIAVGLSGLLIRSAYVMKETVEAFEQAGINVPVVVGGAALSREFTAREIVPAYPNGQLVKYVKDCIEGLQIFSAIAAGDIANVDIRKTKTESQKSVQEYPAQKITPVTPPHIPDFETHIINPVPIDDLVPFINWKMLLHKHMGARLAQKEDAKSQLDKALNRALSKGIFTPKSIFRFFEASSNKEELLLKSSGEESKRIKFARNQKGFCATDWINNNSEITDSVAIFVVTAGDISDAVNEAKESNDLFFSYAIQSLSLEFADACAEYTHRVIRNLWGLEDEERGVRLSPGYPACPDLSIQKTIFEILKPEKIGVNLTDGMMMEPEASVSAIVIHHPDGVYY